MCQNGDPNPNIVMLLRDFVKFQVKRFAVEISFFCFDRGGYVFVAVGPLFIFFSDERFSFGKTTRVSYTETALSIMEISALFF